MNKALPPPPPRRSRLDFASGLSSAAAPEIMKPADEEDRANLNFKVPKDLHRSFTLVAREIDMTNRALIEACFDFYVEHHAERYGAMSPAMQRRLEVIRQKASRTR